MISSRLTVRLALGILCGVLLVFIPAVLSTSTNPSANPSTGTYGASAKLANGPPTNTTPSIFNGSASNGLSLLAVFLFIFLPSTIFSLVIRRWAEKRARDYLWREP